ncbi:MAG TPA: hypothetical protein VFB62_15710 [Polyangiaceae bacterium]|nr:hypothetical protein [Polyangiaceae bacterium]
MPYRHALPPCTVCQHALGAERCARCREPLCLEHLPLAHEGRCHACEHDYQSALAKLPLGRWWCTGFACALPMFLVLIGPVQGSWRHRVWVWGAFGASIAIVEALVITLVAAALLATALVHLRLHLQRRAFL